MDSTCHQPGARETRPAPADAHRARAELLDAVVCLVRRLDTPAEARVLRPLITREIVFRLLLGEQGARLRHRALLGGHTDRIAEAVRGGAIDN